MTYVLGIDLGTGSLKGSVIDVDGSLVIQKSSSYSIFSPEAGYKEQNPKDWVDAFEKVILKISKDLPDFRKRIEAISFSGQMHSLVLLDSMGKVLRNAILWNDVRTNQECRLIEKTYGKHILELTKNKVLEGFTLPKIFWVQRNEPEIWEKVAKILLPKDYLRYFLSGSFEMDYSDAAGTLLLDIKERRWSEKILDEFNIPKSLMPKLAESQEVIGILKKDLREKYQFEKQVLLVVGGADNPCAAIGSGVVDNNIGLCSIGTSGVILFSEKNGESDYEGKLHYFNHVIPRKYYSMGVTLSAGKSLDWFKETFAKKLSYEQIFNLASQIDVGSNGLLFTPYIDGERTPYFDGRIRGSFIGIDSKHKLEHFSRSVLEGILFSLRDSLELYRHMGKKINGLVSVGGGAKNSIWLQMQADILGVPIFTMKSEQGPSVGAAILAAVGTDIYNSIETCVDHFVKYKSEFVPNEERSEKYQQAYNEYKKIYRYTKQIKQIENSDFS